MASTSRGTGQSSYFDAFLKLDGIKGESQDAKHKDEIEIWGFRLEFSW